MCAAVHCKHFINVKCAVLYCHFGPRFLQVHLVILYFHFSIENVISLLFPSLERLLIFRTLIEICGCQFVVAHLHKFSQYKRIVYISFMCQCKCKLFRCKILKFHQNQALTFRRKQIDDNPFLTLIRLNDASIDDIS